MTNQSALDAAEAFQIIIELARECLAKSDDQSALHQLQREALAIIEDIAVSQFADD